MQVLETELSNNQFESSNLKKAVEKGINTARKVAFTWDSSDYNSKQKLQYLIFPEGICYC